MAKKNQFRVETENFETETAMYGGNAGLFVLNMQLYVNVLIGQSAPSTTEPHIHILEMIRWSSLLTGQSECHEVLMFGGIKIFSSDDCEISLWLAGYLRGAICSCVSVSLFCNELSPSQLNEILFSLTKLKQQLAASA